jgi:hypothetical protein
MASISALDEIYIHVTNMTGNVDAFCIADQYSDFEADCLGTTPELVCTCCTICCGSSKDDCDEATDAPAPPPVAGPTLPPAEAEARFDIVADVVRSMSGDSIEDASTPQYSAVAWLAGADPANMDFSNATVNDVVQRYIGALLYFATKGEKWDERLDFLSALPVCDWHEKSDGIYCDDDGFISAIDFGKSFENRTIPMVHHYFVLTLCHLSFVQAQSPV